MITSPGLSACGARSPPMTWRPLPASRRRTSAGPCPPGRSPRRCRDVDAVGAVHGLGDDRRERGLLLHQVHLARDHDEAVVDDRERDGIEGSSRRSADGDDEIAQPVDGGGGARIDQDSGIELRDDRRTGDCGADRSRSRPRSACRATPGEINATLACLGSSSLRPAAAERRVSRRSAAAEARCAQLREHSRHLGQLDVEALAIRRSNDSEHVGRIEPAARPGRASRGSAPGIAGRPRGSSRCR